MTYWDQPYPLSREHMSELREALRQVQAAEQQKQESLDDYIAKEVERQKTEKPAAEAANPYEFRIKAYPQLLAKPMIWHMPI